MHTPAANPFVRDCEVGGYTFSRWTMADNAKYADSIRSRRVRDARRALDGIPPSELSSIDRAQVVAEMGARPVTVVDFSIEMRTPEGFHHALRLGLRRNHPDVTDDEIDDITIEKGGLFGLLNFLIGLDAVPKPEKEDDTNPPAPAASPKTGQPSSPPSQEP